MKLSHLFIFSLFLSTHLHASDVTISHVDIDNRVDYFCGIAVDTKGGQDSSTVTGWSASLKGQDTLTGENWPHPGSWVCNLNYDQQQSAKYTENSISASGSGYLEWAGPGGYLDGWNKQAVFFSVSSDTAASFSGSLTGAATVDGQSMALKRWHETSQSYVFYQSNIYNSDGLFAWSGTLTAGDYVIINTEGKIRADGVPAIQNNSWEWALTFETATVSTTPQATKVPVPAVFVWFGGALLAAIASFRIYRKK